MDDQRMPGQNVRFDKALLDDLEQRPIDALRSLGVQPTKEILAMVAELDFDHLRALVGAFESATTRDTPSIASFP